MSQAARCPRCRTVFRVQPQQLKTSGGWARCGQCGEVFNAMKALVALPAASAAPVPGQPPSAAGPVKRWMATPSSGPSRPALDSRPPPASALYRRAETPPVPGTAPGAPPGQPEAAPAARTAPWLRGEAPVSLPLQAPPAAPVAAQARRPAPVEPPPEMATPSAFAPDTLMSMLPDVPDTQFAPEPAAPEPPAVPPAPTAPVPSTPAAAPVAPPVAAAAPVAAAPVSSATPAAVPPGPAPAEALPAGAAAPSFLQAPHPPLLRRLAVHRRLWLALSAALALTALLQLLFIAVPALSARSPAARGLLQPLCTLVRCSESAPRRLASLSVDSSALSRLSGDDQRYRLSLVLRNRDERPLRWPAIELRLTDAQGVLLVRKVLRARELGAATPVLDPGSEQPLQAVLDMGDQPVAGYSVELFYP